MRFPVVFSLPLIRLRHLLPAGRRNLSSVSRLGTERVLGSTDMSFNEACPLKRSSFSPPGGFFAWTRQKTLTGPDGPTLPEGEWRSPTTARSIRGRVAIPKHRKFNQNLRSNISDCYDRFVTTDATESIAYGQGHRVRTIVRIDMRGRRAVAWSGTVRITKVPRITHASSSRSQEVLPSNVRADPSSAIRSNPAFATGHRLGTSATLLPLW